MSKKEKFNYIISGNISDINKMEKMLGGNDMADAIVHFMLAIQAYPDCIISLLYCGKYKVVEPSVEILGEVNNA
jgi:hypothetical protein